MILARDVKPFSSFFACQGEPVSGLYQVDQEVVAMILVDDTTHRSLSSFYTFRGQHGTVATGHEAGVPLELLQAGEML